LDAEAPGKWFDRTFTLDTRITEKADLFRRLREAPARVAREVETIPEALIRTRPPDRWSIAEHVGHLADLEPLWLGRVQDVLEGRDHLRDADLENRATWEANHNAREVEEIVADLVRLRGALVGAVTVVDDGRLLDTALHPRLRQPMSILDLCFFVAEHDDHHLAIIRALRAELGESDA
jgi:uncharacterized damage-inducible protein DinB